MIYSVRAHAAVQESLYKSAEASAMGGVQISNIDDDMSLFINPAGLAGAQDLKIRVVNATIEASDQAASSTGTFMPLISGGISATLINKSIGQNLFARVQDVASVSYLGFCGAAIADVQSAIRLINPSSPSGTVAVQSTYGGQVGYGTTVYKLKKKRGEIKIGVALKYLMRAGGYHYPTTTDILTINTTNIVGNYKTFGYGIGGDSGVQGIYRLNKQFTVMGGFSATDIANTTFSNAATTILANYGFGIAVKYRAKDVIATLGYDFDHAFENIDWLQKTHIGLQLKFPILTLYGGFNQVQPSYGAGLDFGIIRLMFSSYYQELSTLAGVDPEHRYLLNVQFDFKL